MIKPRTNDRMTIDAASVVDTSLEELPTSLHSQMVELIAVFALRKMAALNGNEYVGGFLHAAQQEFSTETPNEGE